MNHQELYKIIKSVHKNVKCPQCGQKYDLSEVRIRGILDSVVFLELNCPDHMPLLATVAFAKNITSKKQKQKISSNDVIDAHQVLKNFRGNFEQAFKNSKK